MGKRNSQLGYYELDGFSILLSLIAFLILIAFLPFPSSIMSASFLLSLFINLYSRNDRVIGWVVIFGLWCILD